MLKKAIERMPEKIKEGRKRFEIPIAKIEYSGQKTILKNFKEIVETFRREEKHLSKFLAKELATIASIDKDSLIFQGKIINSLIQKKLEDYAKIYIYCKECGNADTRILKEDRTSFLKCDACGAKKPIK